MTLDEKGSQLSSNAPAIDRLGISAFNFWAGADFVAFVCRPAYLQHRPTYMRRCSSLEHGQVSIARTNMLAHAHWVDAAPAKCQVALSRLMLSLESRAASLASYAASRMAATWFSFCRTLLNAKGIAPTARAAATPKSTFLLLTTRLDIDMTSCVALTQDGIGIMTAAAA